MNFPLYPRGSFRVKLLRLEHNWSAQRSDKLIYFDRWHRRQLCVIFILQHVFNWFAWTWNLVFEWVNLSWVQNTVGTTRGASACKTALTTQFNFARLHINRGRQVFRKFRELDLAFREQLTLKLVAAAKAEISLSRARLKSRHSARIMYIMFMRSAGAKFADERAMAAENLCCNENSVKSWCES